VSVLAVIVALPAAAAVIAAVLRSSLARRLVARPSRDRWHERATPSVGGVGIFAGLLAGTGAALGAGALDPSAELFGILGGCAVLFLAGLADDRWSLGPVFKLGAQLAAVGLLFAGGITVEIVNHDVLAVAIAVVWLVAMTNAFNLLDNMDGFAATLAAIACGYFAIAAATVEDERIVLVLGLAGGLAAVGFLPFNLRLGRPAAVFMGDSGSQVLGFLLAALGLAASWKEAGTAVATIILPILVLAVPIFDTALVTVVRLLEGRPIYRGGRDHTSHRLVYSGLSERRSLVMLALVSAALGATSLGYAVLDDTRLTLVGVLLTFALLVQLGSFLGDVERTWRPIEGRAALARTFVLHRRRLVEMLVDFALITASFLAAYLIRVYDGSGTPWQPYIFGISLPVILAARYTFFIALGLYRGVWRYAGARDAVAVVVGVVGSQLAAVGFLAATQKWADFPRMVFVIDALLCTILIGASRFSHRGLARLMVVFHRTRDRRLTLIVGAGRGGRSLVRELRETPGERVVGFVDDDPVLRSRRLLGTPVLGRIDEIDEVLETTQPDAVLVTIPDAPRERLDRVVRACDGAGVPCRFVRRDVDLDPQAVLGAAAE
jgi:UDP-GlcNAc:undecaprenyl-phosphate/decaprenyl-phosphate GlcNAc-1-phosphate transferase